MMLGFLRWRRFNSGELSICRMGELLCCRLFFLLAAGEAGELRGRRCGVDGGVKRPSSRSRKRLMMFSSVVSACNAIEN